MPRKDDLRQINEIAQAFGMTATERRDFGNYLEDCKADGDLGSKNERGDFSWGELEQKARDFLRFPSED